MRTSLAGAKSTYVLMPAAAIGMLYAMIFAMPQYRELGRLWTEAQQQSSAIDQLALCLNPVGASADQTGSAALALTAVAESAPTHSNQPGSAQSSAAQSSAAQSSTAQSSTAQSSTGAIQRSEQTFVQAFAHVMVVFESQGLDCTSSRSHSAGVTDPSNPAHSNGPDKFDGLDASPEAQRISLTGNFVDLLAAVESIEAEIPQTTVAELSMQRLQPSDPCHWEITLRFNEAVK